MHSSHCESIPVAIFGLISVMALSLTASAPPRTQSGADGDWRSKLVWIQLTTACSVNIGAIKALNHL